jgi:hypothetical protein
VTPVLLKEPCFHTTSCSWPDILFPLSCRDFSWSPGGNIIAFWVPEDKDIPARVTLMQLPSRQEIRVRNLFNVVDCKLHWQKNGDYLCVKVDRTPKGTQARRGLEQGVLPKCGQLQEGRRHGRFCRTGWSWLLQTHQQGRRSAILPEH